MEKTRRLKDSSSWFCLRKTEVMMFIVSILLVSSVYSIEISWPNNVPFGSAFHEILYTDVITSADNDGEIEVNGTLIISSGAFISGNGSGLYDLNFTGITLNNIIIEGNTNFTGNVSIGGVLFADNIISDY
ncbi:hypothetical protein KY313_01730, partial [Candidatus Woesearchaeota archaeon]|nr:hypothetical protein [Candidatus Woesearchaeota archaeon]